MIQEHEKAGWRFDWVLRRYNGDIDAYRQRYGKRLGEELFFRHHKPVSEQQIPGNLLMTAGADLLIKGLITAGGLATPFSNANAYIGVGDSTTAENASQTDLQAATNKTRIAMDATYPQHTNGTNSVVFSATAGPSVANFAWNEWGVFNGSAGNTMLNRKVPGTSLGTKTGGTWQLQGTLSVV